MKRLTTNSICGDIILSAHLSDPASRGAIVTRPILGITLKIASVAVFVGMSTLLKAAEGIPVGELVFFRSFFAIFAISLYLVLTSQFKGAFYTKHPMSHFWRGLVGVSSMVLSFYALTKLPLPEAIALNYASPLIAVVLSAVFLKEIVRMYRWTAVLIGLIGVIIMIWPRLSVFSGSGVGQAEALGALAALSAATLSAFAMMLVRRLVFSERTATIVIYFSVSATVLSLLTLPFGWVMPSWDQWMLLVGAGFAGGLGQILLTECYRHAPMSTIAPFEYTSMLLSLFIGFMIFGDIPTVPMIIGTVIVIMAGIMIIYREHSLSKQGARK